MTANQRKAAERARKRAKGFKLVQFWVHPADWPLIRAYIDRKNKQRSSKSFGAP